MMDKFTGDVPLSEAEQLRVRMDALLDNTTPARRAAVIGELVICDIAGSEKISRRDRARLVQALLPLVRAEAVAGSTVVLLRMLRETPAEIHPLVYPQIAQATIDAHKEAQRDATKATDEAKRILWSSFSPQEQEELRAAGVKIPEGL